LLADVGFNADEVTLVLAVGLLQCLHAA
jgi:hypothetical protein